MHIQDINKAYTLITDMYCHIAINMCNKCKYFLIIEWELKLGIEKWIVYNNVNGKR